MSLLFRYGTFLALVLLCLFFTLMTFNEQFPKGSSAARLVAASIQRQFDSDVSVLIAARKTQEDHEFVDALKNRFDGADIKILDTVQGDASDARKALENAVKNFQKVHAIACTDAASKWLIFKNLDAISAELDDTQVIAAAPYTWPDFLKRENLLNIAQQNSVIAIIAVGMTFVIIAGGIDLSVGSLIALGSVIAAILMRDHFGGEDTGVMAMIVACAIGVAACALVGVFSGLNVVLIDIPPFIVTLAMMLIARGAAQILTQGQTVQPIPESFEWLGNGADIFGIPNSVILMIIVYVIAHFLLSRTVLGRHIYAVGGNQQAAFLSGVPVKKVLVFTYFALGLLAGIGGIITASRYRSGSSDYGTMDELRVIAAVVVGGTSLSGGRGTILGTLVGAFIIAVILNGMNLLGVTSFWQTVILGAVILAAVMLDKVKYQFLASQT